MIVPKIIYDDSRFRLTSVDSASCRFTFVAITESLGNRDATYLIADGYWNVIFAWWQINYQFTLYISLTFLSFMVFYLFSQFISRYHCLCVCKKKQIKTDAKMSLRSITMRKKCSFKNLSMLLYRYRNWQLLNTCEWHPSVTHCCLQLKNMSQFDVLIKFILAKLAIQWQ